MAKTYTNNGTDNTVDNTAETATVQTAVSAETVYGIASDYEWNATHKTDGITVWSGPFASVFEARGTSHPANSLRSGYTLITYNGDRVTVFCPTPRNEANYRAIDWAVSKALNIHYQPIGVLDLEQSRLAFTTTATTVEA